MLHLRRARRVANALTSLLAALLFALVPSTALGAPPPAEKGPPTTTTTAPSTPPVALVLVNGAGLSSDVQALVRKSLSGAIAKTGSAATDLSPLTSAIFEAGMLVPAFDRPPPQGWPEALRPLWQEGNLACQEQVGAPGKSARRRLLHATASVECQRILAEALYARLLAHTAPERVLEVTVRPSRGGPDAPLRLQARLFAPGAGEARLAESESSRAGLPEAAAGLAQAVLAGGGNPAPAPGEGAFPQRPRPTVAALEEERGEPKLPALQLDAACLKKLPARLQLTPEPKESRFSSALARRWEATVRAAQPSPSALNCTLSGYPTRVNAGGEAVPAVEVVAVCGDSEHRANAPLDPALRRRRESLHDVLSASLIRQMAAARCGE